MTRCPRCEVERLPSAYYRRRGRAYRVCKACVLADQRSRRAAGLMREPERANYHASAARRAASVASTRRWRERNPEKTRAQHAVTTAIRNGTLVRQPCAVEGCTTKAQAHHADYARPLDLQWLCPWHHARQHVAEGRLDHLRVAS